MYLHTLGVFGCFRHFDVLWTWVEDNVAPGMSVTVTAGEKSLPLCSYPTYPRYTGGPAGTASSYRCER